MAAIDTCTKKVLFCTTWGAKTKWWYSKLGTNFKPFYYYFISDNNDQCGITTAEYKKEIIDEISELFCLFLD